MSIAAMQQQLAASKIGDVELRPYFQALCDSIGASMIRDHNQLSLDVSVDGQTRSFSGPDEPRGRRFFERMLMRPITCHGSR